MLGNVNKGSQFVNVGVNAYYVEPANCFQCNLYTSIMVKLR